MLLRAFAIATLEQDEAESVMRRRQRGGKLECPSVATNRLVRALHARIRDGHVLENTDVVRLLAESKAVRRQRRVKVALAFQSERLLEIIEALRLLLAIRLATHQAAQPGHACAIR